jgi:Uma2 family endonuclease
VYDRSRKKDVYEAFGIRSYWIVDPDVDKPSLTVFELRRGRYAEVARAEGVEEYHAARPFAATIAPEALVAIGDTS